MTLNDKLSSALKTISGNGKAFDKDLDELNAAFQGLAEAREGLITKQAGLKKTLEAAMDCTSVYKENLNFRDPSTSRID